MVEFAPYADLSGKGLGGRKYCHCRGWFRLQETHSDHSNSLFAASSWSKKLAGHYYARTEQRCPQLDLSYIPKSPDEYLAVVYGANSEARYSQIR